MVGAGKGEAMDGDLRPRFTAWPPLQDSKASVMCSVISSRNLFAGYYNTRLALLRKCVARQSESVA